MPSKKAAGYHLADIAATVVSLNAHTHENQSEAHKIFRQAPGHASKLTHPEQEQLKEPIPGMIAPGSTGVIYVMDRAMANGFTYNAPGWANFGQGAPECSQLPGASERPHSIPISGESVNEYAPTTGVTELRQAVANLYNHTYRQGKKSQYTYKNVCIVPGGRAGLTRVAAVVGDVYVAYQIPEYTAYDNMLSVFRRLVPIPSALQAEDSYRLNLEILKDNIKSQGISVVVASNPRNPTGQAIVGEELKKFVKIAQAGTTLVLDEFYSWYNYLDGQEGKSNSAAEFVHDVNHDPVVLIDGLTKNWRLPGWRCCWVIGPESFIGALSQSGSFLDGGACHPVQVAAISMLEPSRVQQDKVVLQRHFKTKRDHVLKRLCDMGLPVHVKPMSTFYIWLDLSGLPPPINSGLVFFEELLKEKVIVVPGLFFDINPSHRRNLFDSPCHHFVRLSFGPPLEQLDAGLDGIERLLERAHCHAKNSGDLHTAFGNNLKRAASSANVAVSEAIPGHA